MDKGFVSKEKPGFETTESLWGPNKEYLEKFCNLHIIPFMEQGGIKKDDLCIDIGEYNPRIKYIEGTMGIKIKTIDKGDFNWDGLGVTNLNTILALEMFEHVQNPLYFMREIKKALANNGSIYVLLPCNPRWLWHDRHFFEMDRKHFEKWILNPLKLKIIRYKKIWHVASWRAYLIGLRPLWRILSGKMSLKAFIRLLLYVQWWICEIKEDDS
ncbi:MAG: hypothetical protein ACFE95_02675 [Candidatus Hodarchaeota archaeon]